MSTWIQFNVLSQLSDDFLKNIKIIYVFGHKVSEVLIVTKDDTVFGFGQNEWGVLGFGHNISVYELKKVEELSGKRIISFVNGLQHVIGRTSDGKLYSWGRNDFSQLGIGMRNNNYNKPKINEYLISEFIVDISCGGYQSLVLTEKYELFVWGFNNFGQVGNESEEYFQLTPLKLETFNGENIISISCGFNLSLALTKEGNVFSWGSNTYGQLGIEVNEGTSNIYRTKALKINKPIQVKVKIDSETNVFFEKICCGCNHSMLLSKDGEIYTFGVNNFGQIGNNSVVNQLTPQKICSPMKYKDIASHFRYNISIAVSVNNTFYIWGKLGEHVIKSPKECKLKSFNNILLFFNQITYKSNLISFKFETIDLDVEEFDKNITDNFDNEIIQRKNDLQYFSLLFSANIIAKYRNQNRIQLKLNEKINTSIHFYDHDYEFPHTVMGTNSLFVTENSKVYSMGNNYNGLIGFGHKNAINEAMIVKELCNKGITGFTNGFNHVIARTNENHLYIWGYNGLGQLGNETYDDCFVPQLVEKLVGINIIDVRCGGWHSLVLTENGEVYSWGNNTYGQLGQESYDDCQLTPLKIRKFDDQKIMAISCGAYHSLALTESGCVYSWGSNDCGQLGFTKISGSNKPKRIKVKNNNKINLIIKKISCGSSHSLLLTSDGDIYVFGSNIYGELANKSLENHFLPTKIISNNKFIEIASHYDTFLSAALTLNGIYYIWGYCGEKIVIEPEATQFDSFNNIFLNYFEITYNKNNTHIKYSKDFFHSIEQNSIFKINFQDFGLIASGTYGIVSKAENKNENEICAIKRIGLNVKNKDSVLKEFKIMSQLNSDFVIKVKTVWIEDNYLLEDGFHNFDSSGIESLSLSSHKLFNPKNDLLLHIQMELCFKSLKEIIKLINNEMKSIDEIFNETIVTQIHYYITSELLIEILESVDYLHKQSPSIIHRDLKPANILVTHGIDGRFVKLCDFGLAKLHESDEQSHTKCVGTTKYMAPEVKNAQKYNTKADIYSLAVVVDEQIMYFKGQIDTTSGTILSLKYLYLLSLMNFMKEEQKLRPNCKSILNQKNSWALSINDVGNDTLLEEISNKSFGIEDNFHSFFIKKKLEISKQLKLSNFQFNSNKTNTMKY